LKKRSTRRNRTGTERHWAPLLSALADDDASADRLGLLRRHMDTCLSCRRLRSLRAARQGG
jgi:hypothetical protein